MAENGFRSIPGTQQISWRNLLPKEYFCSSSAVVGLAKVVEYLPCDDYPSRKPFPVPLGILLEITGF